MQGREHLQDLSKSLLFYYVNHEKKLEERHYQIIKAIFEKNKDVAFIAQKDLEAILRLECYEVIQQSRVVLVQLIQDFLKKDLTALEIRTDNDKHQKIKAIIQAIHNAISSHQEVATIKRKLEAIISDIETQETALNIICFFDKHCQEVIKRSKGSSVLVSGKSYKEEWVKVIAQDLAQLNQVNRLRKLQLKCEEIESSAVGLERRIIDQREAFAVFLSEGIEERAQSLMGTVTPLARSRRPSLTDETLEVKKEVAHAIEKTSHAATGSDEKKHDDLKATPVLPNIDTKRVSVSVSVRSISSDGVDREQLNASETSPKNRDDSEAKSEPSSLSDGGRAKSSVLAATRSPSMSARRHLRRISDGIDHAVSDRLLLAEKVVDIDEADTEENTLLHYAVTYAQRTKDFELIDLLLRHGARIDIKNREERIAFELSAEQNIFDWLIEEEHRDGLIRLLQYSNVIEYLLRRFPVFAENPVFRQQAQSNTALHIITQSVSDEDRLSTVDLAESPVIKALANLQKMLATYFPTPAAMNEQDVRGVMLATYFTKGKQAATVIELMARTVVREKNRLALLKTQAMDTTIFFDKVVEHLRKEIQSSLLSSSKRKILAKLEQVQLAKECILDGRSIDAELQALRNHAVIAAKRSFFSSETKALLDTLEPKRFNAPEFPYEQKKEFTLRPPLRSINESFGNNSVHMMMREAKEEGIQGWVNDILSDWSIHAGVQAHAALTIYGQLTHLNSLRVSPIELAMICAIDYQLTYQRCKERFKVSERLFSLVENYLIEKINQALVDGKVEDKQKLEFKQKRIQEYKNWFLAGEIDTKKVIEQVLSDNVLLKKRNWYGIFQPASITLVKVGEETLKPVSGNALGGAISPRPNFPVPNANL